MTLTLVSESPPSYWDWFTLDTKYQTIYFDLEDDEMVRVSWTAQYYVFFFNLIYPFWHPATYPHTNTGDSGFYPNQWNPNW
ncbi:MAG: hypothetical protein ACTSRB_16120 [Candidatus Helarchaeota archaeon]